MADPIRVAIYEYMTNDTTLMNMLPSGEDSIFYGQVDEKLEDTLMPILIYFREPGSRRHTFDDKPTRWNPWVIKAVGNRNVCDDIAARLCQLFYKAELTPTEGEVFDIREFGDVEMTETVNGERYDHVGHIFRVASEGP